MSLAPAHNWDGVPLDRCVRGSRLCLLRGGRYGGTGGASILKLLGLVLLPHSDLGVSAQWGPWEPQFSPWTVTGVVTHWRPCSVHSAPGTQQVLTHREKGRGTAGQVLRAAWGLGPPPADANALITSLGKAWSLMPQLGALPVCSPDSSACGCLVHSWSGGPPPTPITTMQPGVSPLGNSHLTWIPGNPCW